MKCFLLLLLGFIVALSGASASSVILDDTFGGSRTDSTLPASTPWYGSDTGVSFGGTPQQKLQVPQNSEFALAYFTPQGSPLTLGVGDSLTLSFTFTFSGTPTSSVQAVRIGLFNSKGSRISSDGRGLGVDTTTPYQPYVGYAAVFDPTGGFSSAVGVRNTSNQALMTGGALAIPTAGTAGTTAATTGTMAAMTAGVPYTGTLTLTREASDMLLSFSVGGSTASATMVTQSLFSSFDTISLFNGTGGAALSFSEVSLTYSAAPEPSSAALFGGAVLLLAFVLGRARRLA